MLRLLSQSCISFTLNYLLLLFFRLCFVSLFPVLLVELVHPPCHHLHFVFRDGVQLLVPPTSQRFRARIRPVSKARHIAHVFSKLFEPVLPYVEVFRPLRLQYVLLLYCEGGPRITQRQGNLKVSQ